jgi:hypothetical protein
MKTRQTQLNVINRTLYYYVFLLLCYTLSNVLRLLLLYYTLSNISRLVINVTHYLMYYVLLLLRYALSNVLSVVMLHIIQCATYSYFYVTHYLMRYV